MEEMEMGNQKGFTLIELLLIVVILGVLASIAIPQFIESSIAAEAAKNLREIGRLQNVYKATYGSFLACEKCPESIQPTGAEWEGNKNFDKLGFSLIKEDNQKKLQYEVILVGDGYTAIARDGNIIYFISDKDDNVKKERTGFKKLAQPSVGGILNNYEYHIPPPHPS